MKIKRLIIIIIALVSIMGLLLVIEKFGNNQNSTSNDSEILVSDKSEGYSFYGYIEEGEYVEYIDSFYKFNSDIIVKFIDNDTGAMIFKSNDQENIIDFKYDDKYIKFNSSNTSSIDGLTDSKYYFDGNFLILQSGQSGMGSNEVYLLNTSDEYKELIALKEEEGSFDRVENYSFSEEYAESEVSIVVLKRAIEYINDIGDYSTIDVDYFIRKYLGNDKTGLNYTNENPYYIFVSYNDQSYLKVEYDKSTNLMTSYSYFLDTDTE